MSTSPREPENKAAESHSAEEALIAARRQKAEALRARGENPFANDLAPAPVHELGPLRARFDAAKVEKGYDAEKVKPLSAEVGTVHVVGRIVFFRSFGKA